VRRAKPSMFPHRPCDSATERTRPPCAMFHPQPGAAARDQRPRPTGSSSGTRHL
jgi:hypothetical protein